MERGLLWLPLLVVFFGLAWSGWNEYQKVEAYRLWAQGFDKAKYDIYTVLGLKGKQITWGKPTRSEPMNIQSFSLEEVREIRLLVNAQPVDLEALPNQGKVAIEFILNNGQMINIPFTEVALAVQWTKYLQSLLT